MEKFFRQKVTSGLIEQVLTTLQEKVCTGCGKNCSKSKKFTEENPSKQKNLEKLLWISRMLFGPFSNFLVHCSEVFILKFRELLKYLENYFRKNIFHTKSFLWTSRMKFRQNYPNFFRLEWGKNPARSTKVMGRKQNLPKKKILDLKMFQIEVKSCFDEPAEKTSGTVQKKLTTKENSFKTKKTVPQNILCRRRMQFQFRVL